MSLSVPETSKKLVQATGRLLRNEQDEGVITIMDKRLVTKRYGKQLLDSLPPYDRIVE
jgi:ATP-dependent DNA helicase DinG